MSIVGTAALGSLSRSVEAAGRAEEKQLTSIRTALRKAIAAHGREIDRVLCGKKEISPSAYEHWHEIADKLRDGLHTVEMCIQEHWKRERCPAFDPIDELIDYATEPMRARAAEAAAKRYLEHREKANQRDRRYRERKRERERRLKLPKPDTLLSLMSLLCEQDGEPAPPPEREVPLSDLTAEPAHSAGLSSRVVIDSVSVT
jgi:hypothetical protein